MPQTAPSSYLLPPELAERLGLSIGTLANWRSQGRGPRWGKFGGSVRYCIQDVEAYERARFRAAAKTAASRISRFNSDEK